MAIPDFVTVVYMGFELTLGAHVQQLFLQCSPAIPVASNPKVKKILSIF